MSALYESPVLVLDPGMHTAVIWRADADVMGRWAVTGSDDKTARVWSLTDGKLLQTIRLPSGPGYIGKAFSVAMSPDGSLIAVGGWTRWSDVDQQQQIYLFDRVSGKLVSLIAGLPSMANHLAFSPDGRHLAAALGSHRGLRIYGAQQGWAEVAQDARYRAPTNWVAFARDGRMATTALDSGIRLYGGDCVGNIRPVAAIPAPSSRQPYGIAFNHDGTRLAVGYTETSAVDLLDGRTLAVLPGPDRNGIDDVGWDLSTVAWSADGGILFAGGTYGPDGGHPVVAWSDAGTGARRMLPAGRDTVHGLVPLPNGDLFVAAGDPWLARLKADGTPCWTRGSPKADFRDLRDQLCVSSDATQIAFGFEQFGKAPARFDVSARTLSPDPIADDRLARARQDGLAIENWFNTNRPTLDGEPLPIEQNEVSRSLAVHPSGECFVLGSEWWLRAFNARGVLLWAQPTPSDVWAVNIAGNGRLMIAAYGDGTIRWHRVTDGIELLAFMPLTDRTNWVAWIPDGIYAATPGAREVLRWHVNKNWDPPDSVAIEDIKGSYQPSVLPLVLQELEIARAIRLAKLAELKREVAIRTHSRRLAGRKLHLLTIGISAYNENYAKNLRLRYADRDASELARVIIGTQGSPLYVDIRPQVLRDDEAQKKGILRALNIMRTDMMVGRDDLAIVHFSGHGALLEDKLFLLPYDVDASDPVGIRTTGLWIEELKRELLALAQLGRVLVLVDACHSGATTMDGAALGMNSTQLRVALAAGNVTVLTSSSAQQVSQELPDCQHGAFTKALLDSLSAADTDQDGLISTAELAAYVVRRVRGLTSEAQTPEMELRYDTTLFAVNP